MKRGFGWLMRKILFGVLAVLGFALAGCLLPPQPIYRTPVPGPPPRPAMATEDLLKLTRAGISEQVMIEKLKAVRLVAAPSSDDLIALKKEGADDRVIEAMLSARVGPPVAIHPYYRSWDWTYDGPWGWGYPYGFYPWRWHFGFRHPW